jgi:hypothetical protein
MKEEILLTIASIGLTLVVTIGYYVIFKAADTFGTKADEIEEMMRNDADKELVLEEIIKLRKLSFHRITSQRLREVCWKFEIKYNLTPIKD